MQQDEDDEADARNDEQDKHDDEKRIHGVSLLSFVSNGMQALKYTETTARGQGASAIRQPSASIIHKGREEMWHDGKRPCDVVFMDPPYNKQLEKEMLIQMQHASFINEETMIIIEASLETGFDWLETYGYIAAKVKKYKTNQHVFVQRVLEK